MPAVPRRWGVGWHGGDAAGRDRRAARRGRDDGRGDAAGGGFWAADGGPREANLTGDGIVGFSDLLEFQNLYNDGC
ncbi:MAG: hypothetical protein FJ255_02170 [Phycisphaerae bacterium]|nr:hypothetical protein [Phycisphaerae bacterium]